MPRTTITPQMATSAGIVVTYEPANVAGNSYRMVPARGLRVKNGSGASITVTIPTPLQVDGLDVTDRAITVAAGAEALIALGTTNVYKQPGGVAWINYSAVTSVTVAVIDLP